MARLRSCDSAWAELRRVLRPGAPIAITLGSIRDGRFGFGVAHDDNTFAPGDGPEIGIPHSYFDRDGVLELLKATFIIDAAVETNVDAIVGNWAHDAPQDMWHWFISAHRAAGHEPASDSRRT